MLIMSASIQHNQFIFLIEVYLLPTFDSPGNPDQKTNEENRGKIYVPPN